MERVEGGTHENTPSGTGRLRERMLSSLSELTISGVLEGGHVHDDLRAVRALPGVGKVEGHVVKGGGVRCQGAAALVDDVELCRLRLRRPVEDDVVRASDH